MNNKYTFWDLCKLYDKIEIPIIQRDYAQGRNTADVQKLRDRFINDFLMEAIVKEENIELDFVYGSVLTETKDDLKQTIFIPLDGQQRLTALERVRDADDDYPLMFCIWPDRARSLHGQGPVLDQRRFHVVGQCGR